MPFERCSGRAGRMRSDGLDDVDAHVLVGIDAVEPVGDELPRRAVQLGRELDPGGAGADDGDLQLLGPERPRLRMRADAGVDEPAMEALGLLRRVEGDGIVRDPGGAEVVAHAADRDDQRVVGKRAARRDLGAGLVEDRRHLHLAPRAVEPDHLADAIAEVVPMRLRQIVELVVAHVHAAGGDLVEKRLPQMGARLVDERDLGAPAPAQAVAEARRELEPAGAAAHDDDAVALAAEAPGRGIGHGMLPGFGVRWALWRLKA